MAAIINNVSYSWSMIEISFPDTLGGSGGTTFNKNASVLKGITSIKWNKTRKVEQNYGIGGNPIGRGFGNKSCTASIVMDYALTNYLRSVAGNSLMDLGEFDLIISFSNTSFGGEDASGSTPQQVTLKGCLFNEDGFEAQQDDTNITHEYDLNPYDIIIGTGSSKWL